MTDKFCGGGKETTVTDGTMVKAKVEGTISFSKRTEKKEEDIIKNIPPKKRRQRINFNVLLKSLVFSFTF